MPRLPDRMRIPMLLIALVPLLGAVPEARAEYPDAVTSKSADDFGRSGGYIQLGAGGAWQMFTGPYEIPNSDIGSAILIGLRLGGRLNRYAALDASFDYSVRGFTLEDSGSAASIEARSLTGFANLKLYPTSGRIQPYVLGGVGFLLGALDCTDLGGNAVSCAALGVATQEIAFAGRAGGGLDVYLTRHLALTGEVAYVIPTGELSDLNYLQFAGFLTLRF